VITPHFSYSSNFTPQWRLSADDWRAFQAAEPAVATLLQHDRRIAFQPPTNDGFASFTIAKGAAEILAQIAALSRDAAAALQKNFYDAHRMMADVLDHMYAEGELRYGRVGNVDALARTEGACKFCVNDRWTFPLGCPYGKPDEPSPTTGWLEQVTAALVQAGRPNSIRRA
jgi:hypothetical protein